MGHYSLETALASPVFFSPEISDGLNFAQMDRFDFSVGEDFVLTPHTIAKVNVFAGCQRLVKSPCLNEG
jgi:hypothetical protein